jgi:hypothetical protein
VERRAYPNIFSARKVTTWKVENVEILYQGELPDTYGTVLYSYAGESDVQPHDYARNELKTCPVPKRYFSPKTVVQNIPEKCGVRLIFLWIAQALAFPANMPGFFT